jgi:hypothetical protein
VFDGIIAVKEECLRRSRWSQEVMRERKVMVLMTLGLQANGRLG